MTDPNDPKATEVRILAENGGIIRWSGEDADTIAGILSAFAEAARAKGKPLPDPAVIPPCKVHRKVTVVEGTFSDYGDDGGMVINYQETHGKRGPGRRSCGIVDLLDVLPDEATSRGWKEGVEGDDDGDYQGERPFVYRFEVEVIDPADMKAPTEKPRPKLEIVPS